jgi:hypothetical protein
MNAARPLLALAAAAALAVACGSGGTQPSGPASGTLTVNFQTLSAAVETDTLLAFVFDAADAADLCHELEAARRTQQAWPVAPLATSPPFSPCGDVPSLPAVTFGDRAIVVVGQAAGKDVLIGCQREAVSQDDTQTPITLIPIDLMPPKASTCTSLAQFCARQCK